MKTIFVHGAGGTGAVWHYQARHFSDADAVTLPGHPGGEPCDSVEGYARWLRTYITGKNYGPVILAGQSMGGGIALSYALSYPADTAGLVLIGSGARLRVLPAFLKMLSDNAGKPPSAIKDLLMSFYGDIDPPVRETVWERQSAIPISVHLNDFNCCDRFDVMNRLAELRTPTLVICGDKDAMTPLKYSRHLADIIPGSRLAVIPGAGHMVFLERPDEVNREIETFVGILTRQ